MRKNTTRAQIEISDLVAEFFSVYRPHSGDSRAYFDEWDRAIDELTLTKSVSKETRVKLISMRLNEAVPTYWPAGS